MSVLLTIFGLLAFLYSLIVAFLLTGLFRHSSSKHDEAHLPFVSIIIAARNEAMHIERCLKALVAQEYPTFLLEIVVVDDRSTDESWQIIRSMASRFGLIQAVRIEAPGSWASSKKTALRAGVARAKGSILLFTDADCFPPSTWIRSIIEHYDPGIGMVVGFSPQCSNRSKGWNGFLLVDSLASAFVAAGSIGWGHGVTCTGRNLSCRRQAINDIGGYDSLPDSVSGDDDFLLQAISRHPKWKVAYSFARESQVPAAAPDDFGQFLRQKRRHISSGKYFSLSTQIGYGFYHFANYGIWFISILGTYWHAIFVVPLILKICFDWAGLTTMARKTAAHFALSHFLIWELLFPLYHLMSGPGAFFGRIFWKAEEQRPV